MLFYAPSFLFFFLPLVLISVLIVRTGATRNLIILAASYLFYFWGEPCFVFVVLASGIADWWLGMQIYRHRRTRKTSWLVAVGVVLNIGVLAWFKYLDFFIESLNEFFLWFGYDMISPLGILLPLGVSFIVFGKITYIVDIARGRGAPAPGLTNYLMYVMFFPKLLAGPIVKYHDFEPQILNHRIDPEALFEGFERFLMGLAKKVLLADTLGEIADEAFGIPQDAIGCREAWLGMICFTLQIWLDFSAYSDMAIGLARMMGFRIPENFNKPYTATSFTDFWRRWHISLSSWIREYLYFPLGGNRKGPTRTYVNLWACFLLSGLWHGASWTFVLWGAWHGLFLVLDKLWLSLSEQLPRLLKVAITLAFVMIGWLIFRAQSLGQAAAMLQAMFDPSYAGPWIFMEANHWAALAVAGAMALVPNLPGYHAMADQFRASRPACVTQAWVLSFIGLLALGKTITITFNPFLYFRF